MVHDMHTRRLHPESKLSGSYLDNIKRCKPADTLPNNKWLDFESDQFDSNSYDLRRPISRLCGCSSMYAKKVDTTAGQDIVCARKADSDVPEHVYVVTGAAIHVMMTQTVTATTVLNRTQCTTFGGYAVQCTGNCQAIHDYNMYNGILLVNNTW